MKSAYKSGSKSWLCPPQITKGYEFESETDTEVIPKLIKYVYDNRESESVTFSTLVERVIQQLVSEMLCRNTQRNKPNLFTPNTELMPSKSWGAFLCEYVTFKCPTTCVFSPVSENAFVCVRVCVCILSKRCIHEVIEPD